MLYNIFLIMLLVGVVLFIISFILLFVFKVPELIDELSGSKAKRQIKRLKELNSGTNNLDSVATNEVYKSLSSGFLKVDDSFEREEDDEDVIRGVSREIDTGNLVETVENPVDNFRGETDNSNLSANIVDSEQDEASTGYIPQFKISEEEGNSSINSLTEEEQTTGYMDEVEQPTGYIQEYEEATGFMQIMEDEEEATGVLSDVKAFVSNRQFVEILEEQTSLNLSANL